MRQATKRARLLAWIAVAAVGAALFVTSPAVADDDYATERQRMLEVIERHAQDAEPALQRRHLDPRVLEAMERVPRHEFVPEDKRELAYADRPLPIGHSQTISQPFIVALMSDMVRPEPGDHMLEIGTGSGYQAAVLAQLVERVDTVEIIPDLAQGAAETLKRLGYNNVDVHEADGYYGWPDEAPYDGIIVTAAASSVPPPLIEQLRPGGRLVIPVGGAFALQHLMLVEKQGDGSITSRQTLPVAFVPLTRADD